MFFINQTVNNFGPKKAENNDLVNEKVRFPSVLVIDSDGQQLGVMSSREALQLAYDQDLDLYCVAPNGKPPVCKILNYSKFKYAQIKKAKEAKKNQKITETKEVRFTPLTDKRDLEIKAKAALEWLNHGDTVKVTIRFKGRQLAHPEIAEEKINIFISCLGDAAVVDKKPMLEGYRMYTVLVPNRNKK